jgi:hypothetical protein
LSPLGGEINYLWPHYYYFQKAVDDRSPDMVYARVAPRLIPPLGESAEYRRMVEKMGFPGTGK